MIAEHYIFNGKNYTTINEVLDESEQNWIAEQDELMGATSGIFAPGKKLLYRNDTKDVLGVVGKDYIPTQNADFFAFFDTICQTYGGIYEHLYVINKGSKLIIQAKLAEFEPIKGDAYIRYLTGINSFDGGTTHLTYNTTVRMFCNNQQRASLRDSKGKNLESISIRHTRNSHLRLQDAFRVFNLSNEYQNEFVAKIQYLSQKAIDKATVEKFLNDLFKVDPSKELSSQKRNERNKVIELFESGKGNKGRSAYDLYNGVTEYIDHFRGSDKSKRIASSIIGNGSDVKARAFDLTVAL